MNEATIPNETAIKKIVQYLAREATKYQDMIGLDAAHDIDISGLQSAIEDSNNKKILNFWNKLSSKQKNEIHDMVSTYLYNKALKADPDYYGDDQPTPVNYKLSSKTATPTKAPAGGNEAKLIKSLAKKAEDWMNYVDIDSPENISYDDFEEFVINDPKNKKLQAFWNSMGNKKQENLFYKVVDVLEKKYGDGDEGNDYDAKIYDGSKLSKMLSKTAKKMIKENKSTPLMLNGKEVDEKSIEIEGVDRRDYPDFSDAYISAANYIDGTPLSNKEIEELDAQNNELVHEKIQDDQLYMQEGEEEKLGSSVYDREDREERGQYSNKSKMTGITFFNVPSGKESIATQYGLTQFKSGKWGYKHRFDPRVVSVASDREKSVVSSAERIFGKGRYWEPRN